MEYAGQSRRSIITRRSPISFIQVTGEQQVQWRFMKHRKMVMADPIKRFGEIRPSEVVSPTLLATDYKSPHLVVDIYER